MSQYLILTATPTADLILEALMISSAYDAWYILRSIT